MIRSGKEVNDSDRMSLPWAIPIAPTHTLNKSFEEIERFVFGRFRHAIRSLSSSQKIRGLESDARVRHSTVKPKKERNEESNEKMKKRITLMEDIHIDEWKAEANFIDGFLKQRLLFRKWNYSTISETDRNLERFEKWITTLDPWILITETLLDTKERK